MIDPAGRREARPPHPLLARFLDDSSRDPTGSIALASDRWDLTAYTTPSPLARAPRISFTGFGPLTPYLKWYALERRLLAGRSAGQVIATLAAARRASAAIDRMGIDSFQHLAAPGVFNRLWDALLDGPAGGGLPRKAVWRQQVLTPFWRATRQAFGVPLTLPSPAVFSRKSIAVLARDRDRATPRPVIAALVNRLALHRDGVEPLSPLDHQRLCVVVLHLALGRRIRELLGTRRGDGPDGPLVRYVAADEVPALGFRFLPNKGGRDDMAYVSPEWAELVTYATREILAYSDAVRADVAGSTAELLILISSKNDTSTGSTKPLRYGPFCAWLNGNPNPANGVMSRWRISASGRRDDPPYRFRTHGARHARASALAADRNVSPLTAARDLNDASRDVVSVYQHELEEQHAELRRRSAAHELIGLGATWVAEAMASGHRPGQPRLLDGDDRLRRLLAAQPELLEFNRVPGGYCTRPQGPAACPEYLACVEATEQGCAWLASDPADGQQLIELDDRMAGRWADVRRAQATGQEALAGKLTGLAERAERFRDAAVAAGTTEAIERLRAHLATGDAES